MSAGARRPARGSLRIRLAQIATKGQISDRAGGRAGNIGYRGVAPGAERFGATKIVASGSAPVARLSIRLGDKGGVGGQLA